MAFQKQVLVGDKRTAAGQRDKFVTIQQATQGTGGSGFPIEPWTTLRTAWMGRLDDLASEAFGSDQLSSAVQTNWYCDVSADMDPDTVAVTKARRLLYKGRRFDILAATKIGDRSVELITIAKVDD